MDFTYKGYYTKIRYSEEENWYSGKLEGIRDLVNFGSANIDDLETEFHSAVDDYLSFCEEVGKTPQYPTATNPYSVAVYKNVAAILRNARFAVQNTN